MQQHQFFSTFQELISTPFHDEINAMCWQRELVGDFSEIVSKVAMTENMMELDVDDLMELELSEEGNLARKILLNDMEMLTAHGASPILNIIENYERDDGFPFFPTDVYSFHVDRSPIPGATYLCTYHGASSEIVANAQAQKKVDIPEIRQELRKLNDGSDDGFENFLMENYFDLHYQADENAPILSLGNGHLWKLAIDHPQSPVLPCLHRAPLEKKGEKRLLLIC